MTADEIIDRLEKMGDPEDAIFLQRFFKTGKGEYGEGDSFLGIRVPATRKLAREYRGLPIEEAAKLLLSPLHEARLLALLILNDSFKRGDDRERERIYRLYLANTSRINNWDLVDSSAEHIVGPYLKERSRAVLRKLARSTMLWERRIAIMATFHFIKGREYDETLAIAEMLLDDREDLIHKAVGWMLREIGNRDIAVEEEFLARHYRRMPRTMLRYAIEKFPEERRLAYLRGEVGGGSR
jgi:3-methyladenine DNA glycosylase AlkD